MEDPDIARLLGFWFGELEPKDYWTRNDALDERIRREFGALYERASAGGLDHWQETPEGALALVIALDQLPRNMFRGEPRAFATDEKALDVAEGAIERGFDRRLPNDRCMFLYMPFEHSEDLSVQERSLEIFRRLGLTDEVYGFVVRHHEIVARFGRFPHRNRILGRETTPEEAAFLEEPNSSFGGY
ncbi:DUF924 family protein [Minwuia thermotolerans]|uniref:DUF924 domain-containing protein n=1 Tax=Minwuia thermotolerans TaxID=2056226 RepID=A0A2M9FY92_9PROT|nr:DUF924 family protein [Minwuia thermotolerans]PJK28424.1 DUF924 domain-containing protein [Minwuia thermotolerans]